MRHLFFTRRFEPDTRYLRLFTMKKLHYIDTYLWNMNINRALNFTPSVTNKLFHIMNWIHQALYDTSYAYIWHSGWCCWLWSVCLLCPALHDSASLGLAVYGPDWGPCQPAGDHCSVFSRPEQLSLRISHWQLTIQSERETRAHNNIQIHIVSLQIGPPHGPYQARRTLCPASAVSSIVSPPPCHSLGMRCLPTFLCRTQSNLCIKYFITI